MLDDFIEDVGTSRVSIGSLASPITFVWSPLADGSAPLKPSALPPSLSRSIESSIRNEKSTEASRSLADRFLDGEPAVLDDLMEDVGTSRVSIGLLASPIPFVFSPFAGGSSPLKPTALPPMLPSEPVPKSSEDSRRLLAGRFAGVGNADAMLVYRLLFVPPVVVVLFTPSCYRNWQ